MVKNKPNDSHLNCSQQKDLTNFMKVEISFNEENYHFIEESNYLEQLEMDND